MALIPVNGLTTNRRSSEPLLGTANMQGEVDDSINL